MKKGIHYLYLFLILTAALFLLTGCSAGSTINTVFNLNNDMSGTRVMTIVIDNDVFKEHFTGKVSELTAALKAACPSCMTVDYQNNQGSKEYTVTMSFSSESDYQNEVFDLIGKNETNKVTLSVPSSIWANGLSMKENFTSADLLSWMKDTVVDKGFVPKDNADKVFTTGTSKVVYNGTTYDSYSSSISIDQIQTVGISSIQVYTDLNADGTLNRKFVFDIPQASLDVKGDQIKSFMDGLTGAGITAASAAIDDGIEYTYTAQNLDVKGLDAVDKVLPGASSSCTDASSEAPDAACPFKFSSAYQEKLDWTQFLTDNNATNFIYDVKKPDDSYTIGTLEKASSAVNYLEDDPDHAGYTLLAASQGVYNYTDCEFPIYFCKNYEIGTVNVSSSVSQLNGSWKRTIDFVCTSVPTEDEQKQIISRIEALYAVQDDTASGNAAANSTGNTTGNSTANAVSNAVSNAASDAAADTTDNMTGNETGNLMDTETEIDRSKLSIDTSGKAGDSDYTVTIVMKGTESELADESTLLFNSPCTTAYAKDRSFVNFTIHEAYTEMLTFGDFLDTKADDFTLNYSHKLGMSPKAVSAQDSMMSSSSMNVVKGALTYTTTEPYMSITYEGTCTNLYAVLFWVLIAVGVVLLLLALFKAGILKKPAPRPVQMQPGGQMQPGQPTQYGQSMQYGQQMQQGRPMQPVQPMQNGQPIQQGQPTQYGRPMQPGQPGGPVQPMQQYGQQAQPGQPGRPTQPGRPMQPGQSTQYRPMQSGQPVVNNQPAAPVQQPVANKQPSAPVQQPVVNKQPAAPTAAPKQVQTPAFCTECGAPLLPGARFCKKCGAKVEPIDPNQ